ncbi:MAG: family 10 glycosylhydrolase [Calditrichaceae bacterium]|nr:family 10 glycosylhydrolase [Calditrichaceae bacterium]MBN2709072.1 family 10 glycosylhydrolase [Calditrichaceae bacterium]RQV97030.1 MAG: hypothetical protein EH224_02730 [Calditrichota bacterium]
MKKIYFVNCLILFLFLSTLLKAANHTGLWVVRHALQTEQDIKQIIDTAGRLKITTLYIQVYALGQSYWDSEYLTESKNADVSHGLLTRLIHDAHKKNLSVYAWINVFYIWGSEKAPVQAKHPFNFFNHSILCIDPEPGLPDYNYLKKTGNEGFYIDPVDKNYLNRMMLTIKELLLLYDFDGLHFDYFRYPRGKFLHSISGRTDFMLKNYFDPLELTRPNDPIKTEKKRAFLAEIYNSFLYANINNFLSSIRKANPGKIVSIAVKPNRYMASAQYKQDWKYWLENDLCDQVMLMNYDTDFDQFKRNIKSAEMNNGCKEKIIIGISVYNQSSDAVIQRIKYLEQYPAGGIAYFSYNYLQENPVYIEALIRGLR